ncbi:MAG: hypothetical protein IKH84_00485 [Ottowia sp.]|nr:hypothetical protein [Ottowia sp.]
MEKFTAELCVKVARRAGARVHVSAQTGEKEQGEMAKAMGIKVSPAYQAGSHE